MTRKLPAWFLNLNLRESLLVWLSSAQSRYESAAVKAFGERFGAKAIRLMLRQLQRERLIDLAEFDRVRWAIHISGRNAATWARVRAKAKAAA